MTTVRSRVRILIAALLLMDAAAASAAQFLAVAAGVIAVKGASSSSAGTPSALPEEGAIANGRYDNAYFGLQYSPGTEWTQRYEGPPPSESGNYVLAQIEPKEPIPAHGVGHLLIAAQDLFFSMPQVRSAADLISYYQKHLGPEYRVERAPIELHIANRDFVSLDYLSPVAGLHWHVLATEIRCHVVQFVFTGSSSNSLHRLAESLNNSIQPSSGAPICLKDFATADTLLEREDPVLSEPRFNPVPLRIVIDKEGRVKNISSVRSPNRRRASQTRCCNGDSSPTCSTGSRSKSKPACCSADPRIQAPRPCISPARICCRPRTTSAPRLLSGVACVHLENVNAP